MIATEPVDGLENGLKKLSIEEDFTAEGNETTMSTDILDVLRGLPDLQQTNLVGQCNGVNTISSNSANFTSECSESTAMFYPQQNMIFHEPVHQPQPFPFADLLTYFENPTNDNGIEAGNVGQPPFMNNRIFDSITMQNSAQGSGSLESIDMEKNYPSVSLESVIHDKMNQYRTTQDTQ